MSCPIDATPLPTHLLARPKSLIWQQDGEALIAGSPVGVFTVARMPNRAGVSAPDGLWIATLNYAPFPIIAPTDEDARNLATLGQIAHGDTVIQLVWQETNGRFHAEGIAPMPPQRPMWVVEPSQGTAGWYVLRDFQPALIPLSNQEQAMMACDQYVSYLWLALSDIAPTKVG